MSPRLRNFNNKLIDLQLLKPLAALKTLLTIDEGDEIYIFSHPSCKRSSTKHNITQKYNKIVVLFTFYTRNNGIAALVEKLVQPSVIMELLHILIRFLIEPV